MEERTVKYPTDDTKYALKNAYEHSSNAREDTYAHVKNSN